MNKPFNSLSLHALAVGAVVLLAQSAHSQQVLYNNTTGSQNVNFDPASGVTFGNEVVLGAGGPNDTITQFEFQFNLTGTAASLGSEGIDVTFYANDSSTLVNGSHEPGTVLWTSGTSTLASQGLTAFTSGNTLTYSVPSVVVPLDFTWAVTFSNLQAGDSAGLGEYNPVTVGYNYDDAWVETSGVWALDKSSTSTPYLFGAEITGTTVPEPSTIALAVMGAFGFLARRRKN